MARAGAPQRDFAQRMVGTMIGNRTMDEPGAVLRSWGIDVSYVRRRVYEAPTALERERWHAIWLVVCGVPVGRVAALLERDPATVAGWLDDFAARGPSALSVAPAEDFRPPWKRGRRRL
jgi:hypothetical protein